MIKQEFEFEILVNGKSVAEYAHQGKTFIEGKEGTEFTLRFRNRSSRRALFVPTIDGLSVMDGKEASLDSSGYIVGAYDSETISGWRVTDEKVAKFFFSAVSESYAAKTGKGENVGVIGCAVFKEKQREPEKIVIKEYVPMPYPVYPQYPCCPWGHSHHGPCYCNSLNMNVQSSAGPSNLAAFSASNSMGSTQAMSASAPGQVSMVNTSASLGTGFGEVKREAVTTVSFEREYAASAVFKIYYNTRANLEAAGVEFKRVLHVEAQAFPKGSYCVPPEGWQE